MSFKDCLNRGVAGGEIDPKRAERVVAEYDAIFAEFQRTMGPTQADFKAAEAIVNKTRREAIEKRRVQQLQAAATQTMLQRMERHRGISGDFSPADFVQDFISNKRGAGGQTVAGKYEAIRRSARSKMTAALREFSANLVGGRRNADLLKAVEREIFGETTGNAKAARIAQSWAEVAEQLRTRFNAAGGHIGKRSDWGLPQSHDSTAIRRAGYDAWREAILPKLDLEKMGRDFNDGVPFTPETLEVLLKDAFEAIRTDGYSRRSPSARNGSAMYNRRADHRFFAFKDAESWAQYNQQFGAGEDSFRIMISHMDNMANEIALMEELGPNPTHGYQFLKDAAMNMAQRSSDEALPVTTKGKLEQADHMFDLFTGVTNQVGNKTLAMGASAVRQFLTSAHLGSAIISSLTDFNTQRVAAGFIGMNQMGFMRQLGKLATDSDFRAQANDAGLIFENAINMGNAAARYNLEEMHIEGAQRLADFTIRSSGLGHLTELQRQAFGLEFMNTIAKGRIDETMQRVLKDYGIGPRELEILQNAPRHKMSNGLEILRAQDLEEAGHQAVADLYMEAISSLTEFAVPSTDIYGRAAILGRARAGTIGGELIRSMLQFKAFPITVITTQVSRIINEVNQGRKASALTYGASLFVGSTLLGGAAIQLKEMTKGKDPRDATTPQFWVAAAAQGGGLGIFGDFMFGDVNRFGGGLASTIAGPSVGFANDMLKFTVGNVQEAALGEETKIGREFTDLLRRYTPGGSLWYARLAYEREVLDQLQRALDPKAQDSFNARTRRARETDTQFFAPPGRSLLDSRAPDLGNAVGG